MSPQEVIKRAQGGYVAGLLSLPRMERYVSLALYAERSEKEVDYMQTLELPFPWTIEKAMEPRP